MVDLFWKDFLQLCHCDKALVHGLEGVFYHKDRVEGGGMVESVFLDGFWHSYHQLLLINNYMIRTSIYNLLRYVQRFSQILAVAASYDVPSRPDFLMFFTN